MPNESEICFKSEDLFTGTTGTIDRQNAVIRGVSVITGGLTAEGHNLEVDDTLLNQIQASAKERGKVAVCLDHGSGVKDLNGYLTGFRRDGDKLRADWHLLKSHDETPKLLERAEVMPTCFGMSTAFKPPKGNMNGEPLGNGKFAARCERLMSVDCVIRPAANAGLFSVPEVDSSQIGMAKEKQEAQEQVADPEPTLQDVMAALNQLNERIEQHEQVLNENFGGQNEPSLQDLVEASDEDLAQLGLTRAEVDAAVQEVLAGMEGEQSQVQGQEQAQVQGEPAGVVAGVAGEAVGGTSGAANFAALQKEVIQLKNKQALKELQAKRDAEEIELKSIEEKVMILAEQRDKAIKLAEGYKAENDALRLANKTGTRPVRAGVDNGMRLFSANDNGQLHEFQVRVQQYKTSGKTEGEAILLAQKENPALHADWLQSLKNKPATAA